MNYLFYDYETSGQDEVYDQILQFGAIKTDSDFNQIGDPIEFFCKLRCDVLPSPMAIKVNQIDISELNEKGLTEFEFAKKVAETLVGGGDQCVVGYNSKNFDNKFTRFLFYRNFLDPYAWTYARGNSCFDIYDLMSLGYSFDRLMDIQVSDENGPSLKLENLAKWNGLAHDEAHDAVSDVKATIQLAKLVRKNTPKLFDHALGLRNVETAAKVVNTTEKFFHSSGYNGYPNNLLSLHTRICPHPIFNRSAIGWNLRCDPTEILQFSAIEIRDQMYSRKVDRTFDVGFDEFKLNQSPMVTPYFEMAKERIVDYETCIRNLYAVRENHARLAELAREIFNSSIPEVDPDADLYAGDFFGEVRANANAMNAVRDNPVAVDSSQLQSTRLKRLLGRLKARNFFDKLGGVEQSLYIKYCSDKFTCTNDVDWITISRFNEEMDDALDDDMISERQKNCLAVLQRYADALK